MSSPSAALLRRTNLIKSNLTPDLLTEVQHDAYEQIEDHAEADERFVNVHGLAGAGKTILCWVFATEHDWQYLTDPNQGCDEARVIVDHADPNRDATRDFRAWVDLNSLTQAIYVTRSPAAEIYPRVTISKPPDHQEIIRDKVHELSEDTTLV